MGTLHFRPHFKLDAAEGFLFGPGLLFHFHFHFPFHFYFLGFARLFFIYFLVFFFFLLTQAFHCTFNATLSRINCHWPRLVSWHAPAAPAPRPISISLICAIKIRIIVESLRHPLCHQLHLHCCLLSFVSLVNPHPQKSFSSAIRSKWQLDAIQGHCFP